MSDRHNLLIVTTIPETISSFLLPFVRHFRDRGWRVDLMACGVSGCDECLQAGDRVWDVTWSRNPLDPRNLILAPRLIREVIAREKYDIVHVHTPVAAFVTRYALKDVRKSGKPLVIYTAHGFHFYRGGNPLKNAIFLALEKLAGAWTDDLVVINREDEAAAQRYKLISAERIRYMPGIGVDWQHYNPAAVSEPEVKEFRQQLGLVAETPLLLSIAEFIPRKRHQDILTAFARLTNTSAHLALAGDGPLLPEMQKLALDLGILDRVSFLGYRQDISPAIRASVATILVSAQEGLPRSAMESLALETPVIGTDIRGTQELLAENCGILVKVGDVEGIARAIAWILEHPEDAKLMGKRGRERMSKYDLRYILELHEALYLNNINKGTVNSTND
jgi:glycosyltransferase involved in cell wall biosynthesis